MVRRRQLSIVPFSAKLRPLPSFLPPSSAFFEISLSFLLFHDRKSDETSRLVLKGWRANLSSEGGREAVQDSCPTYSERLRDLNGNISLPPNPEWPSENVRRLEVQSTFSNGFRNVFEHLQHPSLQFLFPRLLFIWDWRSAAFIHLPK